MPAAELKASKRDQLKKKSKRVRSKGLVPAVVYGRKFKSTPIQLNLKEFIEKVEHSESGFTTLISLKLSDDEKTKTVPVITHQIQRDSLTDEIMHIDFRHLIMDEAIETKIPVELIGEPLGVKENGGILIQGLREVAVKSLPANIPDKFEVDVSQLKIGDSLHVSDLPKIEKAEIMTAKTEMIANVAPPAKEEEVAAPPPTPEEVAAAEAAEGAVAEEAVKEKSPPGAAPPSAKASGAKPAEEKPAKESKK